MYVYVAQSSSTWQTSSSTTIYESDSDDERPFSDPDPAPASSTISNRVGRGGDVRGKPAKSWRRATSGGTRFRDTVHWPGLAPDALDRRHCRSRWASGADLPAV